MAYADSFTKQARTNAGFVHEYRLLRDADQVELTGPDAKRLELLEQRDDRTDALQVVNLWDQPGHLHSAQRLWPITAPP